jgi:hypothetical protein
MKHGHNFEDPTRGSSLFFIHEVEFLIYFFSFCKNIQLPKNLPKLDYNRMCATAVAEPDACHTRFYKIYTHKIDVMSEVSIIQHSIHRFNFITTYLLHLDGRLEGL